ncbi:hypothetical protein KQX54_019284 [Cotesia glomerata]|uniref:Uncharacterized protein n=1 Tax=Cotesia glomerata TaxID=32391 RepID=A0AAV7IB32_COTGL|nr:hypothetical protein KQX54_019284 [Cotesia glomerata]
MNQIQKLSECRGCWLFHFPRTQKGQAAPQGEKSSPKRERHRFMFICRWRKRENPKRRMMELRRTESSKVGETALEGTLPSIGRRREGRSACLP